MQDYVMQRVTMLLQWMLISTDPPELLPKMLGNTRDGTIRQQVQQEEVSPEP